MRMQTPIPGTRASRRIFEALSPAERSYITRPCDGDAHSNGHIDHCWVCMSVAWGVRLVRADSDGFSFDEGVTVLADLLEAGGRKREANYIRRNWMSSLRRSTAILDRRRARREKQMATLRAHREANDAAAAGLSHWTGRLEDKR